MLPGRSGRSRSLACSRCRISGPVGDGCRRPPLAVDEVDCLAPVEQEHSDVAVLELVGECCRENHEVQRRISFLDECVFKALDGFLDHNRTLDTVVATIDCRWIVELVPETRPVVADDLLVDQNAGRRESWSGAELAHELVVFSIGGGGSRIASSQSETLRLSRGRETASESVTVRLSRSGETATGSATPRLSRSWQDCTESLSGTIAGRSRRSGKWEGNGDGEEKASGRDGRRRRGGGRTVRRVMGATDGGREWVRGRKSRAFAAILVI